MILFGNILRNLKFKNLKIFLVFILIILNSVNVYSQVIGEIKTDMIGKESGKEETNLGNFLCDAIREITLSDVAILSAGAVGDGIDKGEIKQEDVYKLTPYADDKIVVLELKGIQIKKALERSIRLYPKESLSFLQVSGLTFKFDPKKKFGEKILEIKIKQFLGLSSDLKKEVPLNENKIYRVVTNKFLALGGLGYFKIFNEKNILEETDLTLKQAIINFIKRKKIINYQQEGRIKIKVAKVAEP
jgi:2',3'-cyclic-nucleotide 2'-phosphodiesterase (5'-nucleotidase family)